MAVSFSGTNEAFRDDVRNFLGGVSDQFLKDGVIDLKKDRIVIPYLDRTIDESNHEQDAIDNAIIAYTAERAYNSVPLKSTVSGGGLTTNYATQQYRRELEEQVALALAELNISPPVEGPAAISDSTEGMLRD